MLNKTDVKCLCVSDPFRWSRHPHLAGLLAAVRLGCPFGDDPQEPGSPRGYCWGTLPHSSLPSHPIGPAFRSPLLLHLLPRSHCCSTGQRYPARALGRQTGLTSCLCCPDFATPCWNARLLRFRLRQLLNLLLLLLPRRHHLFRLFHSYFR